MRALGPGASLPRRQTPALRVSSTSSASASRRCSDQVRWSGPAIQRSKRDPEHRHSGLSGQARQGVGGSAPAQRVGEGVGEGGELDDLALLELRGGVSRRSRPSAAPSPEPTSRSRCRVGTRSARAVHGRWYARVLASGRRASEPVANSQVLDLRDERTRSIDWPAFSGIRNVGRHRCQRCRWDRQIRETCRGASNHRGADHDDGADRGPYRRGGMQSPRRITLEIDPGGPPIHGRLSVPPAPDRPFTGWIGLLAALHQAIGPEQAPQDPQVARQAQES